MRDTFEADWHLMESLRPWLEQRGNKLVETRGPERRFQGLVRYKTPTTELVISADRGQWFIEVAPTDRPRSTRFDFEVWSLALGDEPPFFPGPDPENAWQLPPQVAYLRANLGRIERAISALSDETIERLRAATRATAAFPTNE